MSRYCFGVDVGGMSVKLGLFTEEGRLLEKCSVATKIGENGKFIYDDIAEAVRSKAASMGLTKEELLGVGVTMPGNISDDGRLGKAPNIFVEGGYPCKEISERLGGLKTVVLNDANAAALGEMWMGAGRNYGSICMVTLGTGVGGGIVTAGRVIAGAHGIGGEIGHIKVETSEQEACNCGGYGCCEYYASATGIVRVAMRMVANGNPLEPVKPGQKLKYPEAKLASVMDELSAKAVCDMARDGDELALKALNFSMEKLGQALAQVSCVVDPEAFVIGGGVSAAGEFILEMIRGNIRKYATMLQDSQPDVVRATLGNDAGMYGAVKALIK